MKIEITKTQQTVNDVPQEPKWLVHIVRQYGTGDSHWSKDDWLHDFNRQDMTALARKLADAFLSPNAKDL